jgi:hypothetical protein
MTMMRNMAKLEGSINELKVFNQAWNHVNNKEHNYWCQAITKEFMDMKKRGVWEIINKNSILEERSLIGNKWAFKHKKNGIY